MQPAKFAFTSPFNGKFKQNIDKQWKIQLKAAQAAAQFPADVLSMMYWTQTGMVRSIEKRNEKGWTADGTGRLEQLWKDCAYDYLGENVPQAHDWDSRSTDFPDYFPNFVMIDFVDLDKGRTIFELNNLTRNTVRALNKAVKICNDRMRAEMPPIPEVRVSWSAPE